ncbi:13775_t:CDS:2 [Acaulospora morrowiae]|uniref:13775_t:CDS:1 n=1 Tax=Acaulospora morrowiae TaxID=94023 RepID=A0A9N9A7T5_9GLOM|nr:13775_t:CDS:2 [Acaulospora morrowiae]
MSNIDGQSINNKPTLVNDSMDIDTINKDNEGTSSSRLNDTSSQLIHVPTASVNVLSTENRSDFAIQPTKPEEKQTNSTTINMTTQNVFQSVGKDCTTVSPDKKDECSNKELPENIEDKCDFSKQEIVTNPESVQEEIVTFLDKVVVETPSSLFPKDFDVPNDRMEVHSSHPDNSNALVAQPSSEKSVEPDYQPVSTELAILPKSSTEQSSQNNNDNMDTDETPNVQYDKDDVVRSKSADHSEVPQNTNPSGNQSRGDCGQGSQNPSNTIESESSLDGSTHPDNSSEHNNARENRRWRGRRSPSSQIDNEKSDRKSPFNLPKLSDAEFQALPSGSRLFLGNLSTHSTSKKELYDIFSPHGKILQISIKNSFGFVQYDNPESVKRAIEKENGLEVSHGKPWHHSSSSQEEGFGKHSFANRQGKHWNQKGYKDSWYQNDRDYTPTRGNHGQPYQERRYDDYDRRSSEYKFDRRASYDSRGGYDYSDQRDYRPPHYKDENEYRPPRDERKYRRNSYREGGHRDERYSHRSKPYKIPPRDYVEKRQSRDPYRSQSHDEPDDEFPLPRRQGGDVPECQIIVLEEVERNFLWQVEGSFREASISVHTLHLSRKLQIQSVIRQMIMEGVHAVIFMERHLALNGLVNMQIFDQSRTGDNVKYDEYNGIKVEEAVGLLLRTRVSQRTGDLRPSENVMVGGQQNLQQAQQPHAMGGQAGSAGLHPISLNNVNFAALASLLGTLQPTANPSLGIQPMSIIPPGGIQTSQPGLLAQQQPPNIDVQQLLRQLAPQNPGLPNQTPFMAVPPHIASNLGLPPSSFNASLVSSLSLRKYLVAIAQSARSSLNPACWVKNPRAESQFWVFGCTLL